MPPFSLQGLLVLRPSRTLTFLLLLGALAVPLAGAAAAQDEPPPEPPRVVGSPRIAQAPEIGPDTIKVVFRTNRALERRASSALVGRVAVQGRASSIGTLRRGLEHGRPCYVAYVKGTRLVRFRTGRRYLTEVRTAPEGTPAFSRRLRLGLETPTVALARALRC